MQKIKCWIVNVLFVVFFTVILLFCIGKGEKATCIVEVGADSGVEFVQLFYSESMSNTFSEEKSITVDEREKGIFEIDLGKVMENASGLRLDFEGDSQKIEIERIAFRWPWGSRSVAGDQLYMHLDHVVQGVYMWENVYWSENADFGVVFSGEFVRELTGALSAVRMYPVLGVLGLFGLWGIFCLIWMRAEPRFSRRLDHLFLAVEGIFLALGAVALYAVQYLFSSFGNVSWTDLMFLTKSPLNGSNLSTFGTTILYGCLLAAGVLAVSTVSGIWMYTKKIPAHFWRFGLGVMLLLLAAAQLCIHFDWLTYYQYAHEQTKLYENEYVDGRTVSVTFPEQKRNLICIYLESMETTYADRASGGAMEENIIPELTELAREHVDFSDGAAINGGYPVNGAGFTLGALLAQTSGVPINERLVNNDILNSYWAQEHFYLSGVYSIGDLLAREGYRQMFMVGSDGTFAGRNAYFHDHGDYEVWDYYTAIEKKKIDADYRVWWGYEDEKLISFAKESIQKLSQEEEPFNFTMLTVDTHFTDGYVCGRCGDDFDQQYSNVLACSSRQIGEFVEWIMEQPFYENTTIVLTGDHLTMDSAYISNMGADTADRKTYLAIINPAGSLAEQEACRQFSTLDLYPTMVAALGAEIEGNRLGLGVNLFSGEQTLVERMGLSELNDELLKNSGYYQNKLLYK